MEQKSSTLSILIPTYNDNCLTLVKDVRDLCLDIAGLDFEILVGDDGSTSTEVIEANKKIDTLSHCKYLLRGENTGRARIRNYLAHEAQYDLLLFIDTQKSIISADFINNYLSRANEADVIYGGQVIVGDEAAYQGNLRRKYEVAYQKTSHAALRQENPYANFNTSNFIIRRETMITHPLDERFTQYGYEDVLYGKSLESAGIKVLHINNPVGLGRFESNERYVNKTEEALRTLHAFSHEIGDHSRMLRIVSKLRRFGIAWLPKTVFLFLHSPMRHHLVGKHPSLKIFHFYRLGYFLSLDKELKGEK